MSAKQQVVPLTEFGGAMLEADGVFGRRVREFEGLFGPADADTLAVLAQAAYLCWFECQYEGDLLQVCRAVGTGKPTSSFSCLQITPDRWAEINTYVVAVQRWLGVDLPLPPGIDHTGMHTIVQWLGERSPAKDALAALFLCQLVDHLVLRASFSKLGQDPAPEDSEYVDFTPWYNRADGIQYATGSDYDDPCKRGPGGDFLEECRQSVRQEMSAAPDDAEQLIAKILRPSQPPCMHRFSRYQDIKLASIGALKWRGHVPPDDLPKEIWQAFWDEAVAAVHGWLDGAPPEGEAALTLHQALAKPTERSQVIVRDFLLGEPLAAYDWLKAKAGKDGSTAGAVFGVGGDR